MQDDQLLVDQYNNRVKQFSLWLFMIAKSLQVSICTIVTEPSGNGLNHLVAGEGIAGVIVNSDARGKKFMCGTEEDFNKLAQSGTH